jgi:hypothetical protein
MFAEVAKESAIWEGEEEHGNGRVKTYAVKTEDGNLLVDLQGQDT